MKIKDLVKKLGKYNQEADVLGVFDSVGYDLISISFGGGDGCTMDNCDNVGLHFTYDKSEYAG